MTRTLDTATLDQAAIDYAAMFFMPSVKTASGKMWATGPEKIVQDFYDFTFKDEFDYVFEKFRDQLGKDALTRFDLLATKYFEKRDVMVFEGLLRERLAQDMNGKIGRAHV